MNDDDRIERCDFCSSWIATHTVRIGDEDYHVCDKPRCQEKAAAMQETRGEKANPMELLPEEVRKQLPPLYSQEHEPDPMVICKFFHPLSSWTWYAIEGSPVDENGYYDTSSEKVDFLFFGWVDGDYPELGYFSLHEMQEVQVMGLGIERDEHFTPMRLSEVKKLHPTK
jgi:hypothetical protein